MTLTPEQINQLADALASRLPKPEPYPCQIGLTKEGAAFANSMAETRQEAYRVGRNLAIVAFWIAVFGALAAGFWATMKARIG